MRKRFRRPITQTNLRNQYFRSLVLPHQNYKCLCGKPLTVEESTLDHVISLQRYGPDSLGNFLVRCYECNHEKGCRKATGCELIWLFVVNTRMSVGPRKMDEIKLDLDERNMNARRKYH